MNYNNHTRVYTAVLKSQVNCHCVADHAAVQATNLLPRRRPAAGAKLGVEASVICADYVDAYYRTADDTPRAWTPKPQ